MDKREQVKQAKEMLRELEEKDVGLESLVKLAPLFYSLAIATTAIGVAAASLKDSNSL